MFLVINAFAFLGERFVSLAQFDYPIYWKLGLTLAILWSIAVKLIQKNSEILQLDCVN